MSFLKLSTRLINKRIINLVLIQPQKYTLYLNRGNSNWNMVLFAGSGGGGGGSLEERIEVCQETDPVDYNTIYTWVNNVG
jgi:hypothetical protein